jgi:hypothetical protein
MSSKSSPDGHVCGLSGNTYLVSSFSIIPASCPISSLGVLFGVHPRSDD